MSDQIAAQPRKEPATQVPTAVGFCASLAAVVAACGICLFSQTPVPIEQPIILLLASFSILVPFKSQVAVLLQQIVSFYLFAVLVNESASQYFQIPGASDGISVSYTTVVMLLCAIGYLLGKLNSGKTPVTRGNSEILRGWILAVGIISVHIAVLAALLNNFYGYGHERGLSVLGSLCLYVLLFIFIWEKLGSLRFRQAVGLALVLFYCATVLS